MQGLIATNNNRIGRLEELKTAIINTNDSVANAERILCQMLLNAQMHDGLGFENLKGFEFGEGVLDNNDLGMTASLNMLKLLASNKNLSTKEAANISLLAAKAAGLRVTEGGSVCINGPGDAAAYYEAYNNKSLLAATAAGVRFVNGTPQFKSEFDVKEYNKVMAKLHNISADTIINPALKVSIIKQSNGESISVFNIEIPDEICYAQQDYHKFDYTRPNGTIGNQGCSATALATCIAYIYGNNYSPNDVPWGQNGVTWPTEYCINNKLLSIDESYDIISESLVDGKPCVLKVDNTYSSHYVSVTGYIENANINDLKFEDLIVVDAWGGKDVALKDTKYSQIDDGKCQVVTIIKD